MTSQNHYQVLGVKESANSQELRAAYKKMALKWHPDKNDNSEESNKVFRALQDAWDTLSDEKKKAEYDQETAQRRAARSYGFSTGKTESTRSSSRTTKSRYSSAPRSRASSSRADGHSASSSSRHSSRNSSTNKPTDAGSSSQSYANKASASQPEVNRVNVPSAAPSAARSNYTSQPTPGREYASNPFSRRSTTSYAGREAVPPPSASGQQSYFAEPSSSRHSRRATDSRRPRRDSSDWHQYTGLWKTPQESYESSDSDSDDDAAFYDSRRNAARRRERANMQPRSGARDSLREYLNRPRSYTERVDRDSRRMSTGLPKFVGNAISEVERTLGRVSEVCKTEYITKWDGVTVEVHEEIKIQYVRH